MFVNVGLRLLVTMKWVVIPLTMNVSRSVLLNGMLTREHIILKWVTLVALLVVIITMGSIRRVTISMRLRWL